MKNETHRDLVASERVRIVTRFYELLAKGDVPAVLELLHPQVEWTEAAGLPYCAGTSIGPSAVLNNLLKHLAAKWISLSATPKEYIVEGEKVVVFGSYSGIVKQTGKPLTSDFAHGWTVIDKQITKYVEFADTAKILEALNRDRGFDVLDRDPSQRTPVTIVKELYAHLTAGNPGGALALMSDDIEWITMMDYKVAGRGPQNVLEGMLIPAMKEWEPYTLTPQEFICDGEKVVSVGRFKGTNRGTGKNVEVDYSHIWEVRGGKIVRHRQFIDTGKIEPARHPG
jgi:ketosteroid isomerase-like protein